MTDQKRLISVDVLKGILIVAIVFIHLVISRDIVSTADAADIEGYTVGSESIGSLVIQALYLGLMAFFVFSGYFYRPGRGFVENMRRRSLQLILALAVCAIVLPLLIYLLMAVCGKAPAPEEILVAFQWGFGLNGVFEPYDVFTPHPLCGGCIGYYFLWGMVWGFVIFYALADRVNDDWRKTVAAIIILLVITLLLRELFPIKLPMYAQMGPIAAAFMMAGMLLARYDVIGRIESFSFLSWKSWSVFLGCLLAVVVLVYLFPPGLEFDYLNFGQFGGYSVFIYFAEAMAMFIVYIHLSLLFSRMMGFRQMFNVTGQHTMGILLLHGSVATMMAVPFYTFTSGSWFPDSMGLVPSLVIAVLTIIACTAICIIGRRLLDRNEKTAKLF